MTPLEQLIGRINHYGDINDLKTPRPLVTLEEFFERNDDYGSIGYNFYPEQPSPAEFYELFKGIRSRPNVVEVRVQISQHEMPDEWPSTDTVWIITSASAEDVADWLGKRFRADELIIGWPTTSPVEPYTLPLGTKPIGVWWD